MSLSPVPANSKIKQALQVINQGKAVSLSSIVLLVAEALDQIEWQLRVLDQKVKELKEEINGRMGID